MLEEIYVVQIMNLIHHPMPMTKKQMEILINKLTQAGPIIPLGLCNFKMQFLNSFDSYLNSLYL